MTTNNEENEGTETIVVPVDARPSLLKKNELTKVLSKLSKSTDKVISFLEGVMLNEENEIKVRVQAATLLLEKRVAVSESITRDALARSIGEARLLMAQQATQQKRIKDVGDSDEDEGYQQPKYCPDLILDHSAIKSM